MILRDTENGVLLEKFDDFDLRHTFDCGQCFRFSRISGTVTRGIVQGRLLELEQQPGWVRIKDMDEMEFRRDWVPYFALDTDYAAIHAAFAEDDTLRQAVGYAPGIRVLRQDRFETLISFLISQNNNIPRIKGSIERLCRKSNLHFLTFGNTILSRSGAVF